MDLFRKLTILYWVSFLAFLVIVCAVLRTDRSEKAATKDSNPREILRSPLGPDKHLDPFHRINRPFGL